MCVEYVKYKIRKNNLHLCVMNIYFKNYIIQNISKEGHTIYIIC